MEAERKKQTRTEGQEERERQREEGRSRTGRRGGLPPLSAPLAPALSQFSLQISPFGLLSVSAYYYQDGH